MEFLLIYLLLGLFSTIFTTIKWHDIFGNWPSKIAILLDFIAWPVALITCLLHL